MSQWKQKRYDTYKKVCGYEPSAECRGCSCCTEWLFHWQHWSPSCTRDAMLLQTQVLSPAQSYSERIWTCWGGEKRKPDLFSAFHSGINLTLILLHHSLLLLTWWPLSHSIKNHRTPADNRSVGKSTKKDWSTIYKWETPAHFIGPDEGCETEEFLNARSDSVREFLICRPLSHKMLIFNCQGNDHSQWLDPYISI